MSPSGPADSKSYLCIWNVHYAYFYKIYMKMLGRNKEWVGNHHQMWLLHFTWLFTLILNKNWICYYGNCYIIWLLSTSESQGSMKDPCDTGSFVHSVVVQERKVFTMSSYLSIQQVQVIVWDMFGCNFLYHVEQWGWRWVAMVLRSAKSKLSIRPRAEPRDSGTGC